MGKLQKAAFRMRLVKFIERKFNPARGCRTLRLGSIDRYREFDANTGTGDPDEAQHGFRFGRGFVIDCSKDSFFESPLHTTGFVKVDPSMRGSQNPAFIHGDHPLWPSAFVWPRENFFIYCLTALEDNEEPTWEMAQAIRPGADSAFEIRDIKEFVREMNLLMEPCIKPNLFEPEAIRRFYAVGGRPEEIKRTFANGRVSYVDDLFPTINSEDEFKQFSATWGANMFRCAFRKLKKFKPQREYRIAYMFDHPFIGRMPAAKRWLDIPLHIDMKSIVKEIPLRRVRTKPVHVRQALRKVS